MYQTLIMKTFWIVSERLKKISRSLKNKTSLSIAMKRVICCRSLQNLFRTDLLYSSKSANETEQNHLVKETSKHCSNLSRENRNYDAIFKTIFCIPLRFSASLPRVLGGDSTGTASNPVQVLKSEP